MEPKERDRRESHISSKLHMIYIYSNNVRHPVTKTFTTLHYFCSCLMGINTNLTITKLY